VERAQARVTAVQRRGQRKEIILVLAADRLRVRRRRAVDAAVRTRREWEWYRRIRQVDVKKTGDRIDRAGVGAVGLEQIRSPERDRDDDRRPGLFDVPLRILGSDEEGLDHNAP